MVTGWKRTLPILWSSEETQPNHLTWLTTDKREPRTLSEIFRGCQSQLD